MGTAEPNQDQRSRRRRRWRRLAVALLGFCLVLLLAAKLLTYVPAFNRLLSQAIVWGPNSTRIIDPADDPGPDQLARRGIARQLRLAVGPPTASLSLWILDPPSPSPDSKPENRNSKPAGTILVLHGIQDQKGSMLGVGRNLAAHGYRAVLVDLRSHGRSSGGWLTYGVQDGRDLAQVLDALDQQGLRAGKVGVYGPSYGGAAALQLAAHDPRVRAVVTVATFRSLRDVAPGYVRKFLPLVGWVMSDAQVQADIDGAGRLAGFDPDAANSVAAIARTDARVLLFHGRCDSRISYHQAEALRAAAPQRTKLILLDGETHASIMDDRTGVIAKESVAWFDQWLR